MHIKNLSQLFRTIPVLLISGLVIVAKAQDKVSIFPVYTGTDLGVTYSPEMTSFRVWAPTASVVKLRIYDQGKDGTSILTDTMRKDIQGTWVYTLKSDWKNKYYTYQVQSSGKWMNEVADIYAKAVGVNGGRGMIVNLEDTDPRDWGKDKRPTLKSFNDIIIWEIHTRDLSMNASSGIKEKGKYLGFTEKGTVNPSGEKTGLDHILDLGVTHVHILPVADFSSIDETKPEDNAFNWGYSPQNYNVPEGSYSTNPYDGNVRITEFKQMVKALHNNGLRVILDVVYNHTGGIDKGFEQLVPGYYYRMTNDNTFSNASACGNETASEHPMMRKFMVESLCYWATEYHVDGFRFDLMGIHDIETMNDIRAALDKIDTSIFLYGEGWTAGNSPLPEADRAIKQNAAKLDRIAVFSDEIRDAIRGHWANSKEPGFMCGNKSLDESIRFGIVAGTKHPQIDYPEVNYTKAPYVKEPAQTIVYASCHDNPCLWDKIQLSCPGLTETDKVKIQKLANAIVLTCQGVPFIQAGDEFARTKQLDENSYNAPDSINSLDWNRKTKYKDVYSYYKQLMALRKNHPAFRMPTTDMIAQNLSFTDTSNPLLVAYRISGNANHDKWKDILVFFNADALDSEVSLPDGQWRIVANGNEINEKGLTGSGFNRVQKGKTTIPSRSMLMLVDTKSVGKW